ncbi:MAG: hypothetical protein J5814_05410 [Bacteroidaceae bacterium]|nr:hypothetical protein [Bacteroidaceae bacterium]
MIFVANKKRKLERIIKEFPGAKIFDITSSAPTLQGRMFSPFYPHGNIPIPGDSHGMTATCVEAIWQGLKVFENSGIDVVMFKNDTSHNIKRTVRKFGRPLGHQYGVYSKTILNYSDARRYIYIPAYRFVLDCIPSVHNLVEQLIERSQKEDIVLLDYNINLDNRDITKPLSHAELVKMYIEGHYPEKDEDFMPYSPEELKAKKKAVGKRNTTRKRIETKEDEEILIQQIREILESSERTSKEICDLLLIEGGSRVATRYIKMIPGIKSRTEKRKKFYTLMEIQDTPTLFEQTFFFM